MYDLRLTQPKKKYEGFFALVRDMTSGSIAKYHAISHRITQTPAKQLLRKPITVLRSTICFWLLVYALFLAGLSSGLLCRPSCSSHHTLDNRFQVNRQSIGSYSNRRPSVAWDRYRLAVFEGYCGRQ